MLKKAEGKAGKVREDICVLLRISLWENGYEERCIYSLKFMASMPEHFHKLPSQLVEELLSEKKELYIWTCLSSQARRARGAVGSGWDVLPRCLCHTWTCLTPQELQLCRTLEHLHFNRHSPKS